MATKYAVLSVTACFLGVGVAVNALEVIRLDSQVYGVQPSRSIGLYLFSLNLGLVAVWLMHFAGMATVADANVTLYDPKQTALSAALGVTGFVLGALVASTDPYFGMTREQAVSKVGASVSLEQLQSGTKGRTALRKTMTLAGTQRLVAGAAISSAGVASMHFIGLDAARNTEFASGPALMASASILAFVVCTVGYWIAFRLLQWAPNNERLRTASFIPLTLAICSAHYSAASIVRAPGEVPLPEGVQAEDLVSGAAIVEAGVDLGAAVIGVSCLVMMAVSRKHTLQRIKRSTRSTAVGGSSLASCEDPISRNVASPSRRGTKVHESNGRRTSVAGGENYAAGAVVPAKSPIGRTVSS